MEFFIRNRVATGLAIMAGGLSLGGCTDYHNGKNKTQAPQFNKYSLKVPYPDSDDLKFFCLGADLVIDTGNGDQDIYRNDMACVDGLFTPEDIGIKK